MSFCTLRGFLLCCYGCSDRGQAIEFVPNSAFGIIIIDAPVKVYNCIGVLATREPSAEFASIVSE
jgi:hypothetical protein